MKRPDCGTPRGYRLHLRLKEDTCKPCRKAIAKYMREWRRATGRTKTMLVPVNPGNSTRTP